MSDIGVREVRNPRLVLGLSLAVFLLAIAFPLAATPSIATVAANTEYQSGKGQFSSTAIAVDFSSRPAAGNILAEAQTASPMGRAVDEIEYRSLKDKARSAVAPFSQSTSSMTDSSFAPSSVSPATPSLLTSFQGMGYTGYIPPDAGIAAGPDHVLVTTNSSFAVYSKSGSRLLGPLTFSSLFAPLGLPSSTSYFDPRAVYDPATGRWFMVTVGLDRTNQRSRLMVAVSATTSPTGVWYLYPTDSGLNGSASTPYWGDYPTLGLDALALYSGMNMFTYDGQYVYSKIRMFNKSQLLGGSPVNWYDYWNLTNSNGSKAFTLQPAVTFGDPGVQYMVNSSSSTASFISLWSIRNPLADPPALSRTNVSVPTYYFPPDATQPGANIALDTGDTRLMNAVYRNGSLWTTNTTAASFGGTNVAAVRYYEIEVSGATARQSGGIGSDGVNYFYPSIMVDRNANAAIVFDVSGPSVYAGARFTGRRSSDTLGQLRGSERLVAGNAPYVNIDSRNRNRWGDYNAMALDPDGRRFWMLGQYTPSTDRWAMWVGAAEYSQVPTECDVVLGPFSPSADRIRSPALDTPSRQSSPLAAAVYRLYLPTVRRCD